MAASLASPGPARLLKMCPAPTRRTDGVPGGWGDVPRVIPWPSTRIVAKYCLPNRIQLLNKPAESHEQFAVNRRPLSRVETCSARKIGSCDSDARERGSRDPIG